MENEIQTPQPLTTPQTPQTDSVTQKKLGILPAVGMLMTGLVIGFFIGNPAMTKNITQRLAIVPPTPTSIPEPSATPYPTEGWTTFTLTPDSTTGYEGYALRLPAAWKQTEHSSNFQGTETFRDPQNIYTFIITEQKNLNPQTGKAYTNFRELTGLSYDVTMIPVAGDQAAQPLPRAGSEHIYEAMLFSTDKKLIYTITLETPRDGSKIKEGGSMFTQILSTFQFLPVVSSTVTPTISLVPSTWKTHQFQQYGITLYAPGNWQSNSEDFPKESSSLIRFWQGAGPDTATIQLAIHTSWANTGDAAYQAKNYTVAGTIAAVKVDPPRKETTILDRYQTNVYFEHGSHVYIFTCVHNWIPEQYQLCDTMLTSLRFAQ